MKKIITLVGIVTAIVFLNPAQAKADVRAYVYFNPLSWFFTPPVRVVHKKIPVYKRPVRERVVYVQPKRHKRHSRSYDNPRDNYKKEYSYNNPRKNYKKKYSYNEKKLNSRKYKRNRSW